MTKTVILTHILASLLLLAPVSIFAMACNEAMHEKRVDPIVQATLRVPFGETQQSLEFKRDIYVNAINEGKYKPTMGLKIKAEKLDRFDTLRLFSEGGRIPQNALARLIVMHGHGADFSRAESSVSAIRYFGQSGFKIKSKSTLSPIRKLESFRQMAVESFDFVQGGLGPLKNNYQTPESAAKYVIKIFEELKAETPGIPFIVLAKSSSGPVIEMVTKLRPGLIDMVLLMGSTIPKHDWIESSYTNAKNEEKAGHHKLNHETMDYSQKLLEQMDWDTRTSFPNTKVLAIYGKEDTQIRNFEKDYLNKMENDHPNFKVMPVENAKHDVLMLNRAGKYNEGAVLNTIDQIYKHINSAFNL